jgi:tRNA(Ile)-lysidine synthase
MLMNFFKGTGIAGLRGILPKQGIIVRPLLFAKKEDLKKFAEEHKLSWVEDSSNQLDKYARNYFRNQLVPLLKNIYPEAENNLAHNLQRFKDIEVLYHQSIDQHKKKLVEYKGNEVHIPVLKLQKTVPLVSVVYEIIKAYHFSPDQAAATIALLDSDTGKYIQSATHRIIKNRGWLIISPNQTNAATNILVEEKDKEIVFEAGTLKLARITSSQLLMPGSANIAYLDAKEITFPLLLRKWKTGDYFYPLGMRKKKKLSRFFIDQKLSKTAREKIWVLESGKKIIWVVDQRIDDRFKITASTTSPLRIELKETVQV